MTPEELRAAAEVHTELGPHYSDAVLESFLDKVSRDIDARVDARLGRTGYQAATPQFQFQPHPQGQLQPQPQAQPAPNEHHHKHFSGSPFALAIASLIFGIPISAITAAITGIRGLLVAWIGISIINIAYAVRREPEHRDH